MSTDSEKDQRAQHAADVTRGTRDAATLAVASASSISQKTLPCSVRWR